MVPKRILNARLPRWLLPTPWPVVTGQPVLATLEIADARIASVQPQAAHEAAPGDWDVQGAPVLPGLVDAHTHLDKTFTLPRMGVVRPGLLGAIDAMMTDRLGWTQEDVHARASRGLRWAYDAGCTHVRSHVDWWEADAVPLAWDVLSGLASEWQSRIALQQVSLMKLPLFADLAQARRLATKVAAAGPQAVLGAFVHSSNWDEQALRHVFIAAGEAGLAVDLHVDEELNPEARGLAATTRILQETGFDQRVVCGHTCALAVQPESEALATLDAVARLPITLVSLPVTNLLLQDAVTGRTPRLRGLTLLKEARQRGIPLLVASDNVQDPFCRVGSYDPVDALTAGVLAAQLELPFDVWSESLCRADWLERTPIAQPTLVGAPADLVIFTAADAWGWPSRGAQRTVLRGGIPISSSSSERPTP